MFWRSSSSSHQNQASPPPLPHGGDGEDGYDQYVWEEEGEEAKSGLHAVRFTVSTTGANSGDSAIYDGYDGQGEGEGEGIGGARPTGSPRLSGLFSRFGHQEGSQLLLGGSRKSLHKMNHKNSRSSMAGEASSGSLASVGTLKTPTPSGSSRATPRGSPNPKHPPSVGRSATLRARSPQTTTLLRTDTVRSDSQQRLDQLHGGTASSQNLRRSGSMPMRLGIPSSNPSSAAVAAAAAAAAHQAERVRRSTSRGNGVALDEDTGLWRSVSLGGTKGLVKRDGSKVMVGIDAKDPHLRPSFHDVGSLEEEEEGSADAVGMLVSFAYYLVMPALRYVFVSEHGGGDLARMKAIERKWVCCMDMQV